MAYTYRCTYEGSSEKEGKTLILAKFRFANDTAPRDRQTVLDRLKLPSESETKSFPAYNYLKSNHNLSWLDNTRVDYGEKTNYEVESVYINSVRVSFVRPFFSIRLALDVDIEARGFVNPDLLFPFRQFNDWVKTGGQTR